MEEAATSQVAPDATGSSDAGTAPEATDATVETQGTSETTPPDGTADEPAEASAEEATTPESTEERKSRRERQREARKQPAPPPEPVRTREDYIAEYEAERAARDQHEAAARAQTEKLGRYIGSDQELADLDAIINEPPPANLYEVDLEAQNARNANITKAIARKQELLERRGLLEEYAGPLERAIEHAKKNEALDWLGNQFERGIAATGIDFETIKKAGAGLPEPVPAMVAKLAEELVTPLKTEVAELKEDLEAANSELDAVRRQLGGHAPNPERGGAIGLPSGALTYDAYAAMSFAQRQALRSTPDGRAKIDAMTARGRTA